MIRSALLQAQLQEALALSSADLHTVVMGEPFVGMVHPCKIYNILSLGLPFLAIGPEESHLTDLAARLPDHRYALTVAHGEDDKLVQLLLNASAEGLLPPSDDLRQLGAAYSQTVLRPRLIQVVQDAVRH